MPSEGDQLSGEDFEHIPGAKLFKEAGGTKIEGCVRHIIIYDPAATTTTNHFEGSNQSVGEDIPPGYYVRIIGPADIKFVKAR